MTENYLFLKNEHNRYAPEKEEEDRESVEARSWEGMIYSATRSESARNEQVFGFP